MEITWIYTKEKSHDVKQTADILGQTNDHNTLAVGLRNFIGSFRHLFGVVVCPYLQRGVSGARSFWSLEGIILLGLSESILGRA
jgi:hypothetical protein